MSKKLKLSQWHDGSVLPVHVGLYEVKSDYDFMSWSFFDGVMFNGAWTMQSTAVEKANDGRGCEIFKWRGIVK